MSSLTLLIAASTANIFMGLTVLLKNYRNHTNRSFFIFTVFLSIWAIINHISLDTTNPSQLFWARLVLCAACFLSFSLFVTFNYFPGNKARYPRVQRGLAAALLPVAILTLSPFVFRGLIPGTGSSSASPVVGPAIPVFMAYVLTCIGGAILILGRKSRQLSSRARTQAEYASLGVAITFGFIIFFNFVLVVFANMSFGLSLAPWFLLIFSAFFSYAIVTQHLFEIRRVIARSLVYFLTFSTVIVCYAALITLVSMLILKDSKISLGQHLVYVSVLLILVPTTFALKRYFDTVTKRIFFRDSYESQAFLDTVGDTLVGTIQLDLLITQCSMIVQQTLKSSFVRFLLVDEANKMLRLFGDDERDIKKSDVTAIISGISSKKQKVLLTEDMAATRGEFSKILQDHDIAAIVRLVAHEKKIGYILIGHKVGGNPFTDQDVSVLDIIADELSLAVQNALRFEEISRFNETLQQKVDHATKELRTSNQKLKHLDEAKDEFISMASHQLRTPLTSVKGYISMVLEGDAGEITPLQRQLLTQAFTSSQRMVYLIADLLNVSRLRTGKFVIEAKPVNLADIVESEIEQLKDTAAAHTIKLMYQKPAVFPDLMLDENKVRQVIMNFLDNAIYYTQAGGSITAELKTTERSVEFTVTDTGIGVPKGEQHHLFGKFYRAGNARKARPDGTGLGLFMARKVIIAQGGSVIFRSKEGKGSTFGFVFPLKAHKAQH